MKTTCLISVLALITIGCFVNRNGRSQKNKLEITKLDSAHNYFVFTTRNESGKQSIILARKDSITECYQRRKYIIADSVQEVIELQIGSRLVSVGYYLSSINNVQIRDANELIKIIKNCSAFSE